MSYPSVAMSLLSDFKSKQEYLLCLLNGGWYTTDERFIEAATKMQHSVLEVINATHGLSVAEATEVLGMLNNGPFFLPSSYVSPS